ncbi:MAG: 1-acyl-sn-glycerol-3-phosphate acyltransferase, partial [Candidatus Obscuribacterales bacterium]|nr:1-acyl-sn-glycerol-3-phosphate acyltransferase [Candidatus Obscuribacterales bacterium]
IPSEGIVILVPLHVDPGDVAFVSKALGWQPFWYMIRTTEMYGWRGWMGARTGALAIDEESEKGRSSGFKAAVEAVARENGPRFTVVFAQGELVQSEEIKREGFKEGYFALARIASKKLKQAVYVQPMIIHYRRDARSATMFHRILRAFGSKHFRNFFGYANFGGIAIVGRPWLVDSSLPQVDPMKISQIQLSAGMKSLTEGTHLPKDSHVAVDLTVDRMKILQRLALKLSGESKREQS